MRQSPKNFCSTRDSNQSTKIAGKKNIKSKSHTYTSPQTCKKKLHGPNRPFSGDFREMSQIRHGCVQQNLLPYLRPTPQIQNGPRTDHRIQKVQRGSKKMWYIPTIHILDNKCFKYLQGCMSQEKRYFNWCYQKCIGEIWRNVQYRR